MKIWNIKREKIVSKENMLFILLTIILICIYTKNISDISVFSVLDDEFGYWGNAAYFTGLDWSGVASNINYYSYGYSIILIPLFWIFDNPIVMYKASIILNCILLCGSFLLCYNIAKKLSKDDINKYVLILISFTISMYPAYIVQSNVAWSECALIFFYWLVVYLFTLINEKSKPITLFTLGFICTYLYIIHQRTIGILISIIIVIVFMKVTNKINLKQLYYFFIGVLILLVVHIIIKSNIQSNLYLASNHIVNNDFSGQITKLKKLFTLNGFINFNWIYFCQLFYFGQATFLISFISILELIKNLVFLSKSYISLKDIRVINNSKTTYIYLFLILSLVSTSAISSLFMINPSRIDHILYGRYNEMIIGPIVLIGLLSIINSNRIKINEILNIIFYFILLTVITNLVLNSYGLESNNFINASGLFFKPVSFNNYNVFTSALISIIGFLIINISFAISLRGLKYLMINITLFGISYIFFMTANPFVEKYIVSPNIVRADNIDIANYIIDNDENLPIYFLLSNDFMRNIHKDFHQFLLKDYKIICINENEVNSIKDKGYLIVTEFNKALNFLDKYRYCISANESFLLVEKNSLTNTNNSYIDFEGLNISLSSFYSQNAKKEDGIQGIGVKGFFMYGPYIDIDSGEYKIVVELEYVNSNKFELGFVDIVTDEGENLFFKQEIDKDDFNNKNYNVEAHINVENYTEGLEIRAYSYENSQFKVNKVYINKER